MSKQLLPPLNSFMFSDNPNLVGFPAILVGMIEIRGSQLPSNGQAVGPWNHLAMIYPALWNFQFLRLG